MAGRASFARFRPDPYLLAMLGTVVLAMVLPARGTGASAIGATTTMAIALLFFLYGARLSLRAVMEALQHWRLHLAVFSATFLLFPLLGIGIRLVAPTVLPPTLCAGLLFLCTLPSTVQSSIAFTATARGNVPAAICSASLSSLIGIVLTPLLVALLLGSSGGVSADSIVDIGMKLLAPFVAGQLARRWIGGWMERHAQALGWYDKGSILLIVYAAFSEGVAGGIWTQIAPMQLGILAVVEMALLGAVLATTYFGAGRIGFDDADRTTILFCGSKKSMATGLPMAGVLFAGQGFGLVLPLMLFHQMQLLVCAALARRLRRRSQSLSVPQ